MATVPASESRPERCRFRPQRLGAREVVGFQGEPVQSFMVVQSGVLREYDVTPDGRDRTLRFLFPGDPVGLEGLAGAPRTSGVEAVGRATVCSVPASRIRQQTSDEAPLARDILEYLVHSHGRSQRQLAVVRSGSCQARLAAFLMLLRDRAEDTAAVPPRGPGSVTLPVSRRDIAALLDTRAETISRILSAFAREGIVATGRSWFRVDDEDALLAIVSAG